LIVVNSNQHTCILGEEELGIAPDHNLGVMVPGQSLASLAANLLTKLDQLFLDLKNKGTEIKAVVAQGDTNTTLCSAQVAFYHRVPFFHVEAGLRSFDIGCPFPEEFNRKTIASITDTHFAPSSIEVKNLLDEGISRDAIVCSGNTVNDILSKTIEPKECLAKETVVITVHRRCNQNENFSKLLTQLDNISANHPELKFIWVSHPTPFVKEEHEKYRVRSSNLEIVPPLGYLDLIGLYARCKMVITDSGGIMEESAFLGIPRIILRSVSEREGVLALDNSFIFDPANENLNEVFQLALKADRTPSYIYGRGDASGIIQKELLRRI
jgi:UDP-N-acetylglucosamine 2-epimerase (non-hydrolysing)